MNDSVQIKVEKNQINEKHNGIMNDFKPKSTHTMYVIIFKLF